MFEAEREQFLADLEREFRLAQQAHKPLNSLHEAWAVILEEVDELWEEVRKKPAARDWANIYQELIQIAAMAYRTADNLCVLARIPLSKDEPSQALKPLDIGHWCCGERFDTDAALADHKAAMRIHTEV